MPGSSRATDDKRKADKIKPDSKYSSKVHIVTDQRLNPNVSYSVYFIDIFQQNIR